MPPLPHHPHLLAHPQAKKEGGIPLGTRGVLVSCVQEKENQAAFEAVSLLTEVRLLGPTALPPRGSPY